jgi:predicted ATP-dependent endonuclease of OLD family
MYIEKIKIDKFRVLEDIEIHFQPPGGATADPETGNVINVIAGVNGTGKTSLLNIIFKYGDLGAAEEKKIINVKKELSINDQEFIEIIERRAYFIENTNDSDKKIHLIFISSKKVGQSKVANIIDFMKLGASFGIKLDNDFSINKINESEVAYKKIIYAYDSESLLDDFDSFVSNFIISKERRINKDTYKERLKEVIDDFNRIFNGVDILTRLFDLEENTNKPLFKSVTNDIVYSNYMSDGEKELYTKITKLYSLNPENAVIIIDEPEIAIHPAWQQKIMQIYSRIGKNNQFIVATHSPQIIASVPYKNRILLRKENGKIEPVHMNQPPSGVDVNSILSEIMGADPRPPELLKLYAQYRKFVEERKENTPEALAVKAQLSEESDHSRFMQEMAFLIELRDVV